VPDGRADQRYRGTAAAEGCAIRVRWAHFCVDRGEFEDTVDSGQRAYHASHDLTPVVQATDRNLTPALPHLRTVASGMIRG
jgi:hypothetical protein